MLNPYAKLILRWERRLNQVDPDRRLTPFDWGSDWLQQTGFNGVGPWNPRAPAREVIPAIEQWNRTVAEQSTAFFGYDPVRDYHLEGSVLSFRSPVPTPYRENHDVHARWFPAAGDSAVVVVAQWNSDEQGHLGLCQLLQQAGVSCLRVSMPYHDRRMPRELLRAEYTVDANIGRTIHAARQAVADIRASLDWLESQGRTRLGIMGTSLGSCYALLASAHDARLRVNVFNHVSEYFGDVVWTGLATRHVRQSLEPYLTQEQLREAWRAISPASYLGQFQRMAQRAGKQSLLIWARYDPCFLPEYSRQVLAAFRRMQLPHQAHGLPCGHYTIGRTPFQYVDAWLITRFLRKHLAQ
ncbi:MAG TPA: hypothetical protein VN690_00650 [Terriglobales bacterium]|nr:hypothetical protein [Terriglobales bacterium]